MELFGIELKPGMIIEIIKDNDRTQFDFYIIFPTNNGLAVISYYNSKWLYIGRFINIFERDIVKIYESAGKDEIYTGRILWKRKETMVLSKQEIAKKFNIDLDNYNLEIKD